MSRARKAAWELLCFLLGLLLVAAWLAGSMLAIIFFAQNPPYILPLVGVVVLWRVARRIRKRRSRVIR